MEKEMKHINISKDRFLRILMDACDTGNNGQNMTLKRMLEYLENILIK